MPSTVRLSVQADMTTDEALRPPIDHVADEDVADIRVAHIQEVVQEAVVAMAHILVVQKQSRQRTFNVLNAKDMVTRNMNVQLG